MSGCSDFYLYLKTDNESIVFKDSKCFQERVDKKEQMFQSQNNNPLQNYYMSNAADPAKGISTT